jgi:DNA-binding MarR family transcriptional regulator
MAKISRSGWKQRVIMAAREYGISNVLFRNVVAERLGLNVTDMECLGLLFHKGFSSPSELAAHTGLTSGATTAMLDRLEKSGLIERRPNPDDRRGTLIVLVRSGAEKIAPWFNFVRKAQDDLVSSYSEKDLQLITGFFERYTAMWEEERKRLLREPEDAFDRV